METWLPEKPLGLQHIADGLDIKISTLGAMRSRHKLPDPDGWLSNKAPFWYVSTMVEWAISAGYAPATIPRTWEAVVSARGGSIPEFGDGPAGYRP